MYTYLSVDNIINLYTLHSQNTMRGNKLSIVQLLVTKITFTISI